MLLNGISNAKVLPPPKFNYPSGCEELNTPPFKVGIGFIGASFRLSFIINRKIFWVISKSFQKTEELSLFNSKSCLDIFSFNLFVDVFF